LTLVFYFVSFASRLKHITAAAFFRGLSSVHRAVVRRQGGQLIVKIAGLNFLFL
jgi:hypothetical protein